MRPEEMLARRLSSEIDAELQGLQGLAREFSLLLVPAGCVTEAVANAPAGDWNCSLLVNRRLEPRRAAALAARLGGVPVVREWDSRTTEDAVLVLGQDWETMHRVLSSRPVGD